MNAVHALGDWGDIGDFFSENVIGQTIVKVGTGLATTALGALVQSELGPQPGQLGSGRIIYAPYNVAPGILPQTITQQSSAMSMPVTASLGVQSTAQQDYTLWIIGGVLALILVLR